MLRKYCLDVITVQTKQLSLLCYIFSASKNTDSSVFYTEIETKILNTDSDPKNTDRDPNIRVIAIPEYSKLQ